MKYLTDSRQVDVAFVQGVSSFNSKTYMLKEFDKISILCAFGLNTAVTAIGSATFAVVVGNGTGGSSFAVLTGATLMLGNVSETVCTGADSICIFFRSTPAAASSGQNVSIDGFSVHSTANAAANSSNINSTDATGAIKSLALRIATGATHLETIEVGTSGAATVYGLTIRRRDLGFGNLASGIGCTVSDNTTVGFELQHGRSYGVIEFTAADVVSTNSSYTHFAVRYTAANATATPACAMVIRDGGMSATHDHRSIV
jgi:hypothetical protein